MDTWRLFEAIKSALADHLAWHEYWPLSVTSSRSLMSKVPFGNNFCLWFTGNLLESFVWFGSVRFGSFVRLQIHSMS